MVQQIRRFLFQWFAFALSLFILIEVNYPQLSPQSQLSIFSMLGLILVFLKYPVHRKFADNIFAQILDLVFAFFVIISFGYVLIQTEPIFQVLWIDNQSLGNRAGAEQPIDYKIALIVCYLFWKLPDVQLVWHCQFFLSSVWFMLPSVLLYPIGYFLIKATLLNELPAKYFCIVKAFSVSL